MGFLAFWLFSLMSAIFTVSYLSFRWWLACYDPRLGPVALLGLLADVCQDAAVLLNGGAADYVVTGCGTGEGAMLALNSFPGVICGHVEDPLDAYTFAQINDGNAVAMPFALKNGWGQELNLRYTFEKLFGEGSGNGYPKERVVPEQRNKKILDGVRAVTYRPFADILDDLDPELLKGALAGEHFQEYFFANATNQEVANKVRQIIGA